VVLVLRELATSKLPAPEDLRHALPMWALSRAVPETGLAVVYIPGVDEVYVIDLVRLAFPR
jgi:hypothetical protein